MKTKLVSFVLTTAFLAVIAVLGVHSAHADSPADTVTMNESASQAVTCSTVLHSGGCFDYIANTAPTGGQNLTWTSVTASPSASWITFTPGPPVTIAPQTSATVTYSLNNLTMAAGTYSTTLTFTGQTVTPSGAVTVATSTVLLNLTVAAATPPGTPGGGSNQNTVSNNSVACGTIQLNWTAGTNADSYNINRNGTPLATHVTGLTYTDATPVTGTSYTYTIQSYSATRGVSAFVGFTPASIQTTACGSTGAPVNPTATNTAGNASVVCGTVQLIWTSGTHADSADVFRNGIPLLTQYTGHSYVDATATPGTSYAYTIDSYSATFGTSPVVAFSPASIQSSPCQVNLSLSDELISNVNNQAYPYSSGCAGTQSGTAVPIQQNVNVLLRIDVCNTGTLSAKNVIISSNFGPTSPTYTHYFCCLSGQTVPTTVSDNGITAAVTYNLGTIAANSHATIYIGMQPRVQGTPSQNLQRFINSSSIAYTSTGGHVAPAGCVGNYADATTPCVVSTGYVPFTISGSSGTTQQEIQP